MKMLTFLLKNTDRLVSRMLLNALLFGALAAGVTLLVGAEGTRQWPPQQLSYIATAIIAGFAAYAAAVSILLGAALHGLVRASAPAPQVAPAKPIAPATSTVAAPEQQAVPTS
ncbi:MAG TPA: hypothetical protein VGP82_00160 [Ktedonobacterales bacterium]|jgi:hypothetical protein|nr:hypothetical protein [Ktedonobacterales bacterium]